MHPQAILFANEAFYLAFSTKSLESMERLWALNHPVICIHPGWDALTDRDEIMGSWKNIFGIPASPQVSADRSRVFLIGSIGHVVCYENVAGSILVASNLFVEEEGQIRLVHHQAGHCANPPEEEPSPKQNPS